MLTARSTLLAPDLPHDPKHQPPLPLRQMPDLAGCVPYRGVSQGLHELPVEHRLAAVQQVGGFHAEDSGQRRNLLYSGIAYGTGPDALDVALREIAQRHARNLRVSVGLSRLGISDGVE